MEIGAAFMVGAIAGGWVANSIVSVKGEIPPPPPPPAPPLRTAARRSKAVNLHIEQILDPNTGEDTRTRANSEKEQVEPAPAPAIKLMIKLSDITQVSANLRKAPRPLTMDEKRSAFTVVPLFAELLKATPQTR